MSAYGSLQTFEKPAFYTATNATGRGGHLWRSAKGIALSMHALCRIDGRCSSDVGSPRELAAF